MNLFNITLAVLYVVVFVQLLFRTSHGLSSVALM